MNTFKSLVEATAQVLKDVPRCIMGVSGTDSFLAFLVCAEAYKSLGRDGCLEGYHFYSNPNVFERDGYEDEVMDQGALPWLREKSGFPVETIYGCLPWEDGKRWGWLMDQAVNDDEGRYRAESDKCWVVGSRNKTERLLGRYSNASRMASFEPLYDVWKSDVIALCHALGVPQEVIKHSYYAHCGCGNMTADILSMEVIEVDSILDHLELTGEFPDYGKPRVIQAVVQQRKQGEFKAVLPMRLPCVPNVINVNPGVIHDNELSGTNIPPLRVRRGLEGVNPRCEHELLIKGPCRIKYRPNERLQCGAVVWIETDSEVVEVK